MTWNQRRNWAKFCSEPLELVENYQQAKVEDFKGWCIHHRLEIQPDGTRVSMQELKDKDLYFHRPASELVFMRFRDHSALHMLGNSFNKGNHYSAEARQKIAAINKGRHHSEETRHKIAESKKGENNPLFGKHHSAETRLKMSQSLKGKNHPLFGKHLPEETRKKMSKTRKEMLWWNNGISNKCCRECPGEGWTRGRLSAKI